MSWHFLGTFTKWNLLSHSHTLNQTGHWTGLIFMRLYHGCVQRWTLTVSSSCYSWHNFLALLPSNIVTQLVNNWQLSWNIMTRCCIWVTLSWPNPPCNNFFMHVPCWSFQRKTAQKHWNHIRIRIRIHGKVFSQKFVVKMILRTCVWIHGTVELQNCEILSYHGSTNMLLGPSR